MNIISCGEEVDELSLATDDHNLHTCPMDSRSEIDLADEETLKAQDSLRVDMLIMKLADKTLL
eukprot:883235-Karenia_brevis.AAC.1